MLGRVGLIFIIILLLLGWYNKTTNNKKLCSAALKSASVPHLEVSNLSTKISSTGDTIVASLVPVHHPTALTTKNNTNQWMT